MSPSRLAHPLALLLAVELLNRALKRHRVEPAATKSEVPSPVEAPPAAPTPLPELTAEQLMRAHYEREHAQGRTPSGAELNRVAGAHNYGRRILRKWREEGVHLDAHPAETPASTRVIWHRTPSQGAPGRR